jgi:hypothetical protein
MTFTSGIDKYESHKVDIKNYESSISGVKIFKIVQIWEEIVVMFSYNILYLNIYIYIIVDIIQWTMHNLKIEKFIGTSSENIYACVIFIFTWK